MRRLVGAGMLVGVVLLSMPTAPASAKGASYVTIDGPGLASPLVITDPERVQNLAIAALEGVDANAFPPAWVADVYVVTRWIQDGAREFPFDQVLYVPDPEGGRAFVYYVGIYNGDGPYDRNWYHATLQGQATMDSILDEARASDRPAIEAIPANEGRNQSDPGLVAIAVGAGVALAAAGFALGRSRRPIPKPQAPPPK